MFNLQRGKATPSGLVFSCVGCNHTLVAEPRFCSVCGGELFRVGYSTTGVPIMQDPDSQDDPYRKKHYNPETGQQFNNFGSEESEFSTIGGPNDRQPPSSQFPSNNRQENRFDPRNPDARNLPQDGGEGDTFNEDASSLAVLPDDSPLRQNVRLQDKNPYNNMNGLQGMHHKDPYAILQKRKRK